MGEQGRGGSALITGVGSHTGEAAVFCCTNVGPLCALCAHASVVAAATELPPSVPPQSDMSASVCILVHGYGSASDVVPQESYCLSPVRQAGQPVSPCLRLLIAGMTGSPFLPCICKARTLQSHLPSLCVFLHTRSSVY